ncbi:amino acid carrier protein [Rhodothalassium salexigens DSM 2132]|uniref:Amino acid carrier protein n=1 Tax=Rhodothalassium salexigens DSM 2132 TaxID=1188247 RepID=A0A4R2PQQ1_RHOSA|nr:alanine/glycine:cation symporter family protein [Rhodothalassium salexigens]MBB4209955.1 AGCS family alanine or glycine:cation symporter [Rhodothalassium salexigens DSM 2132]TCP38120.1 amino acid carrier protein [Rhodothalassium salexigens DSM 2132]
MVLRIVSAALLALAVGWQASAQDTTTPSPANTATRTTSTEPVTAPCPTDPTVSDRINANVSPFTDAVYNLVFWGPTVRQGRDTASGRLWIEPDRLREGDALTLAWDDRTTTFEIDRDGAVCPGSVAIAMGADAEATAANLAAALGDRTATADLVVRREARQLTLSAPTANRPTLSTEGNGFTVEQLDDGSVRLPFIVVWLFVGALFFTLRMNFISARGFKQSLRIVSGKYDNPDDPGQVTHFQALTAALSGTVGLGNIAGVAVAISVGGPGATFWMILVGLLAMSSKFTECTLGIKYRKIDDDGVVSGGPMYYLRYGLERRGFGRTGQALAAIFAVLCVSASFGAGNMFQVNQATSQMMDVVVPALFGPDSALNGMNWVIGLIYAALLGLVVIGGIRSIAKVTSRLVPLMAAIYVTAALVVIFGNLDQVPAAFNTILAGAFSPEGVTGGFIGVLIQGMRRATFSNEGGVGSAPIAHSAAKTTEPIAEGLVALVEPFIDTVVVCTLTALVIIITNQHVSTGEIDGITLTSEAFGTVIGWFPYILSVAVLLFAFSTSLTWFYYGERAFLYLMGSDNRAAELGFKLVYVLVLVVGSSMQLSAVVDFADATLLAMAFPNLIGLYWMSGEVKRMLDDYMRRVRTGELLEEKQRRSAESQPAE